MAAPPSGAAPAPAGADVFISYAREDRTLAARLAEVLEGRGQRVWWDRELVAGTRFAERIEAELGGARRVVTLWSADSVRSGFVRDESSRAQEAGKLVPVRIAEVPLPLGFGQLHTLDLIDWAGDEDDERLDGLVRALQAPQAPGDAAAGPREAVRRPGAARWMRPTLVALAVAALAGGGLWWKQSADEAEAEQLFGRGLERQFAREPNLESARNLYLSALEARPQHARARYYLGHVYAQLGQPGLARTAFELALRDVEQLDEAQQGDARRQLQALKPADEPAALAAAVPPSAPTAGPAPVVVEGAAAPGAGTPAPSATPAPVGVPALEPGAGAAPGLPPRLPVPTADQGRLSSQVAALFEGSRDSRIRATTSLILDPDALSDAAPLAVQRALPLVALPQPSDVQLSGVINTLVLLQSALPATLLAHEDDIRQLIEQARPQGPSTRTQADQLAARLQAAVGQRPRAFIQIADEAQRPLARALGRRLRERGYDQPGIELVGAERSPRHSEIRVHSRSDRGLARWLVKVLDEFTTEAPRLATLRNARPATDTYEIWLGADLCTTQVVARCRNGS